MMLRKIVDAVVNWCIKRGRYLVITGTSNDTYLVRYYVFKSGWMNIFIHHFYRSDRDDMHNHPWHFATWLVAGAYTERLRWDDLNLTDRYTLRSTKFKMNRFTFRKATDLHQVLLDGVATPVVTICVTGPKIREWEFERNGVLVPWREYLGLPSDAPDRG